MGANHFIVIGLNVAAWLLVQGAGTSHALVSSICNFGLIAEELMLSLTTVGILTIKGTADGTCDGQNLSVSMSIPGTTV